MNAHTPERSPSRTGSGSDRNRRGTRAGVIRAVALVVLIGGWLAIAGTGGPAIGKLSEVQTNGQEAFLPKDSESVRAANAQKGFAQEANLPALVVFAADGPATPAQLAAWKQFAADLPGLQTEAGPLSRFLLTKETPFQPSADSTAGLVVVGLNAITVNLPGADGESPLDTVVASLRAAATSAAGDGAVAHLTGPAGFTADLGEAFAGIDGILLLVALLAVLLILILVYRAIVLPLVVLFNSVCALAAAGGLVYLLAKADVLVLNGQSQGILFILVVGAATDYGLLLVARFREELTQHEKVSTAVYKAWRACLEPIAASAGTVIAGLLCLLLSDLNSNRTLGPVGAIGIACAAIAAFTLLPALLMAGRWLFWPRTPRFAPVAPDADLASVEAAQHGVWTKIADFVARRTTPIWIVSTVVLALLCIAVPSFKASGTSQTDVFLTDVDSVPGQQVLVDHFAEIAGAGEPVVVIASEGVAATLPEAIGADDRVSSATVLTDAAGATVVVDGRVEISVVLNIPASSPQAASAVTDLRQIVHAADPAALVGGDAAIQLDTTDVAQSDLKLIIPIVLLVVLLVLILLLRSLVAPLLLVFATVLSFGASLGVAALIFNHVLDYPGADPAVPLFSFVFLVALGVDYSIFLMSRAREEVLLSDAREGVLRALRVTGGVITSAGIVLAATFAALSVIPLLFLAQIAFIVAFGVLLDTLLVRSLLVPALALQLGKKTWWPSRISR
ncbi:MMPL family transporter [Nakamurella silvestris]|nr:MMPL family transporter [Nakamurella silvestris]